MNDTQIKKDISGGIVYNHDYSSQYSYDINNFVSFNYNKTNTLQKAKEIGLVKDDTILRELKVKMHSETISMVYLKDKFDEIIAPNINFISKGGIIIKAIILNMASFEICV